MRRFLPWASVVVLGLALIAARRHRAPSREAREDVGQAGTQAEGAPRPAIAPRVAETAGATPARDRPAPAASDRTRGDNIDASRDTMDQIRALVRADPERALALIDAADREHPAGRFAEERAALRVDALVFARRIGPARDAAEEFLTRYPQSPRAQHIQMLTGVHPHPPDPQD